MITSWKVIIISVLIDSTN